MDPIPFIAIDNFCDIEYYRNMEKVCRKCHRPFLYGKYGICNRCRWRPSPTLKLCRFCLTPVSITNRRGRPSVTCPECRKIWEGRPKTLLPKSQYLELLSRQSGKCPICKEEGHSLYPIYPDSLICASCYVLGK